MGSNVVAVFMDEFLFMNKKAFPSIFPTTATGALLVMTSSMAPGGDSSALSLLDVKYDDGTNVIQKLNWIQTCKKCKAKGIPEKCTHVSRPPQHFQSYASQARLSKLLSGDPVAYEREMLNVTEDPTTTPAFEANWIDQMVNNTYVLNEDIKYLYITIDPSGGQNRNLYVLTSTVFTLDGTCVVIGAENLNCCNSNHVSNVIVAHVAKCRTKRFLQHVMPIIIPESNQPVIAQDLAMLTKAAMYPNKCIFLTEDKSTSGNRDLPGNKTTRENKPEMYIILSSRYMHPNKIFFYNDFVISQEPDLASIVNVKSEFVRQLKAFSKVKMAPAAIDKACEVIYSGKCVGVNDDFVITLMMAVYIYSLVYTKAEYAFLRQ